MATVKNPWLRGVTGKVAGMVVQGGVTRGSTIIRERVDPQDPKTLGQRIQRVIMATAGYAYGKMAEIVDHSFEGYNGKAANMNRFRSLNANMLRQKVSSAQAGGTEIQDQYDFSPKGIQWLATNAYIMSEGSLPAVPYELSTAGGSIEIATGIPSTGDEADDEYYMDELIDGRLVDDARVGGLKNYGMKLGDQLTLCGIRGGLRYQDGSSFGGVEKAPLFTYCRFILKPDDNSRAVFKVKAEAGVVVGAELVESNVHPLTQLNGWKVSLVAKEGYYYLNFYQPTNTPEWLRTGVNAATMILSRKVNNKWLRSPSTLSVNALPANPKTKAFSLGEAVYREEFAINAGENDKYLNNAQSAG